MTACAENGILYLSRSNVEAICQEIDPVALMKDVLCAHGSGETVLPDEAYLSWRNSDNDPVRSLNMPGYVGAKFGAAGTKVINSNPANPARGLPRASGVTLLFDRNTARVICIMEGAHISALRTAAITMVALEYLASDHTRSLCVIGSGVVGMTHVQMAIARFPMFDRVILFDLDKGSAKTAADRVAERFDRRVQIEVVESAEAGVRSADVVIAATTVTSGYIAHDWLKPGAVAVNVSLDDFMPDVFLLADLLFVDDWNLVRTDSRRLLGRLHRDGRIVGPEQASAFAGARRVNGELSDLILGRHPGRRASEEIILVNPFGLAIEDVAFASRVFEVAQHRRIGTHLEA
jgi:N-[(2S)-2-amino-2-carboxyethyl]-L-glutamate dehydrogenase